LIFTDFYSQFLTRLTYFQYYQISNLFEFILPCNKCQISILPVPLYLEISLNVRGGGGLNFCDVTSSSTNIIIQRKLPILFISLDRGYGVWVSASNKLPQAASFHWTDNTPMSNTLWIPGYPSYFRNPKIFKACVWLQPVQGRLADYDCNSNSRPFCQAPYEGVARACS
jgi:hypothetical protein